MLNQKRKYIPGKNRDKILIESVRDTYYDFIDFIENPAKVGYMAVLCKVRPESRALIRARLLDRWQEIDDDLRYIRYKMRRAMHWYEDDQPDGMKR